MRDPALEAREDVPAGRAVTRTRTGTCNACGRRRKLYYGEALPHHGLCSECILTVKDTDDIIAARKARKPRERSRKAFICIGGPLDGEHATTTDFYSDGMYEHLSREYAQYNSSGSYSGGRSSAIFVHTSLIKSPISGRER